MSLSFSDHAAVEAAFNYEDKTLGPRSRIIRLDPSLAKDQSAKVTIVREVEEMMAGAPGSWNPHQRLEFLKVCVRTVVEKCNRKRKK